MNNVSAIFKPILDSICPPERKMPAKRFAVTMLDKQGKQYVVITTGVEGYTTACDVEKIMVGCEKIGVRQL